MLFVPNSASVLRFPRASFTIVATKKCTGGMSRNADSKPTQPHRAATGCSKSRTRRSSKAPLQRMPSCRASRTLAWSVDNVASNTSGKKRKSARDSREYRLSSKSLARFPVPAHGRSDDSGCLRRHGFLYRIARIDGCGGVAVAAERQIAMTDAGRGGGKSPQRFAADRGGPKFPYTLPVTGASLGRRLRPSIGVVGQLPDLSQACHFPSRADASAHPPLCRATVSVQVQVTCLARRGTPWRFLMSAGGFDAPFRWRCGRGIVSPGWR